MEFDYDEDEQEKEQEIFGLETSAGKNWLHSLL